MIHVLEGIAPGESELLEASFRLRHQVFVREYNWQGLTSIRGHERDEFDTADAVHIIATAEGKVAGSLRLLPTSKPHLLSTVHAGVWPRHFERGLHCWEWTRYCIAREHRGGKAFGDVASEITIGAVEWGLENDVREVVVEYSPYLVARFSELGFKVRPLGLPVAMDGQDVVAVHMQYGETALERLREARGFEKPIIRSVSLGESLAALPHSKRR